VINFIGALHESLPTLDHSCEASGISKRTDSYIIPWLRAKIGKPLSQIALLEDGCGVGVGIERLVDQGVDAYGIDPGERSEQWAKLRGVDGRLFVANGTRLPFPDCTFDAVTSSGVLEHVGEPRGVPHRDADQGAYMREIVRVLKPGGAALVAHPNGAHPFDFWHPLHSSIRAHRFQSSIRAHRPYEAWMPNIYRVRRWTLASPHEVEIRFLPPDGYLAFDRVRAHFYGRALAGMMRALFRLMSRKPWLARTSLNPWLISEITRR
jgi:SAM-dependent methyltransferase